MSALQERRAEWLDSTFWDRLDCLESRHRQIRSQHESARRGLKKIDPRASEEVHDAWRRYCDVIAELDRTIADVEALCRSAS